MRAVIQRSKKSSVCVDNELVAEIPFGMVLLVSFTDGDTKEDIDFMVKKIVNLRIFDDETGIMNKSIVEVEGSILSISQFTLYADTKKGNRPSYIKAMKGNEAIKLYDLFNQKLSKYVPTKTGIFGADMQVNILNDGPVTILLNTKSDC